MIDIESPEFCAIETVMQLDLYINLRNFVSC